MCIARFACLAPDLQRGTSPLVSEWVAKHVLFLAMVNQAFVCCCRSIDPTSRRSMNVSQGSLELQRPGGSKKVLDGEAEVIYLLGVANSCWCTQHERLSRDLQAYCRLVAPQHSSLHLQCCSA